MPPSPRYRPETLHAGLGETFFDVVAAAEFPRHALRHRNQAWAARVGLEGLDDAEWIAHFGRFEPLPGNLPQPLALRYHGHQFRQYNPQLGDGRGFLFAQLRDALDGRLLDLGTKGSGQTPWSRGADGRLTLKGGVREVLAAAMLEAQGVYTSKAFSLVETGEQLVRQDEPSPTRSAVLVRLSHSHIRIGSFQRLDFLEDRAGLSRLLEYSVEHYLPEARRAAEEDRALAFLEAVRLRVARLGAEWMAAGFVHGVLNTDNITITGESFDYGPWRWLPLLDPEFTAAYFDYQGLYAYGRQPQTLFWNLIRLAQSLLPLTSAEKLEAVLEGFPHDYEAALRAATLARLGLRSLGASRDAALTESFYAALKESRIPFEQGFFDWHGGPASEARALSGPAKAAHGGPAFAAFRQAVADYAPVAPDRLAHAYFQQPQPCSLLIEEVEALWAPIAATDDWAPLQAKLAAIATMAEAYGNSPEPPPG